MKSFFFKLFSFFLSALLLGNFSFLDVLAVEFSADMMLPKNHVRFSENVFVEGKVLRVYVSAVNNCKKDLLGAVRLTVNGKQVGSDQPISVLVGRKDTVFFDWRILSAGKKTVKAVLIPWETKGDDPSNNTFVRDVVVLADSDLDGVPNINDNDDDNDGVMDVDDAFPVDGSETLDSDGDRVGNNRDDDDDNDGVKDVDDLFPLNSDESKDTDGDGIGDRADDDDDNDGLLDKDEGEKGTDSLNSDTDGDGVKDGKDAFPLDPVENSDFDGDGIGDNSDSDDDNDGVVDYKDTHPKNMGPIIEPNFLKVDAVIGRKVTFRVPSVRDDDGTIVKYEWYDEASKKVSSSKEPKDYVRVFANKGVFDLGLRVYDNTGEYRVADFHVMVSESNWWLLCLVFMVLLLLALIIALKYRREAKFRDMAAKKSKKEPKRIKK